MGITYYSIFKNSGGDVGIGTITPSNTKLHIVGDWVGGHSTVKVQTITSFASGGTSGIGLYDSNGTRSSYFYTNNSFTSIGSAVNVPFTIEVNSSEKLRILSNGNVGVGTTSPAYKLDVNGAIGVGGLRFLDLSTNYFRIFEPAGNIAIYLGNAADPSNYFDNTNHVFRNRGGSSVYALINSNGNLGIGTTSPTSKFVVNNNGGTGSAFYVDVGNRGDVTTLFEHTGSSTPVPFRLRKSGYSGSGSSYGLLYLHMNDGTVGNGSNLYFTLNDNAGNEHEYAGIGANILVNTNGAESGDLLLYTSDAGTIRSEKVRVKFNGNVGIGTSSPTAKLQVEGNIRLNGDYGIGADETGGSAHITYCGGGQFATSAATTTGYLKITLPQSWTSTMMQFYVDVYEYSTGITKTFNFGGYNWTGGPSWLNVSAYLLSDNDTATYTARFGHDGTKCAIYIDDSNGALTEWSYVQVTVRDLHVGFNSYSYTSWANGWDVSFTGTLGTITATRTIARFLNTNQISGTTNYVSKFTGTNSLGNSSIFDNGSAVGIGTTTFTYSNSNRGDLEIYGSTDAVLALRNGTANSYLQKLGNNFYFNNSGAGSIFIQNNGSDRVVIDSAGFVGISTSTVAQKLHLYNGNLYIQGTQGFNAAVNYTSFSRLIFNNDYSNTTNRGPNKITLYDDGSSWYGGFGIHDDIIGYYSGGNHVWYKTTSQTASTEYMRLTSGGNVGIGTSNPTALLTIFKTSFDSDADGFKFGYSSDYHHSFSSTFSSTTALNNLGININNGFNTGRTRVMTLLGNGNVGIGTTSPTQKLEVAGFVMGGTTYRTSIGASGSGAYIYFGDTSNLYSIGRMGGYNSLFNISSFNGPISFQISDSEKVRIDSNGNVGIGTTSPSNKLHILGNVIVGNGTYNVGTGYFLRFPFDSGNLTSGTIRGHIQFDSVEDYSVNANDTWKWKIAAVARPGNAGNYNSSLEFMRSTRTGVTDQTVFSLNGYGGYVGIGTNNPSTTLHVYGVSFTFEDTSTESDIQIGPMANNYPYKRFDSYISDNSGYFWGFGQKTSAGVTRVNAFFLDNNRGLYSADQLSVVTWTANEYNSSYPTFTEPVKLRASGVSYFNGGNVGIGTTSPSYLLTVNGPIAYTPSVGNPVVISNDATYGTSGTGRYVALGFSGLANGANKIFAHNTGQDGLYICSATSRSINFRAGGGATDHVVIDSGGNLGVATTAPDVRLHVINGVTKLNKNNYKTTTAYSVADLVLGDDVSSRTGYAGNGSNLILHANGTTSITFLDQTRNLGEITYSNRLFTIGGDIGWGTATVYFPGNVGVGTTSPSFALDVTAGVGLNTSGTGVSLTIGANNATDKYLRIRNSNGNFEIGSSGNQHYLYGIGASNFFTIYTNSTERFRIAADGNVGIGTTSPNTKLEVYGVVRITESASGGILQMQAGSSALDFASTFYGGTYRPFTFTNGGSERMRITSAGNVGIGTTSPANKLHIFTGTVQVSGFQSIAGGPLTFLRSDYAGSAAVQINFLNINPSNGYDSDLGIQLMNTGGSMVDVMRIKGSSGNVGIGTTNPVAQLHINEAVSGTAALRVDGTSGTLFSVIDDLTDSLMSVNNSAGLPVLEVFADDRVVAGQYGANDFVVRNNKVGIGTSNPDNKLQVHNGVLQVKNIATALARISIDGSSASGDVTQIQFRRNGSDVAYIGTRFSTAPSDGLFFYTPAAGDAMVILSNGNIGINRTAPAFKFDVGGTSGFRDSMAFGPSIGLITWGSFGAGVGFGMRAESTRTLSLGANGNFDHIFISLNGNVGIGTTAPTAFFQINSGSPTAQDAGLQFGDDTGTRMYRATGSEIRVTGGFRSGTHIIAGSYLQTLTNLIYPSTYGVSQRLQVSNIAASAWIDGLTLSPGGMVTVPHIFGHNLYSFRGANRAVNDWDTAGLTIVPTVNSYLDGSWYIDAGTSNDWNRGILSKGKFLRVEGLTLEYESYTQVNSGTDVYCMIGFVGGESTSYSYAQTPANLTYQDNGGLSVYTNGSSSGSDYSADTRNGWFRFKTVLKGRGAQHYIYRNGIWNLIKETEINDQNDYEWVRVLVSLYRQRIYFRDFKVYVAQNSYRGDTYLSYISGSLGLGTASPTQKLHVVGTGFASVDFRAPIFYDSADTAYYLDPNGTSVSLNTAGGIVGGSYVYAATYLQTGNGNVYPAGTGSAALNINIGNASGNAWVAGLSLALGGNVTVFNNLYANGSLGVGTTSPSNKLTVLTAANVTPVYFEGGSADWSETTPGTGTGTIHLDPGATTDHFGNAITFGASDSSSGTIAQAGIYVRSDGSYGTKMYFATTNDYNAGSKVRMMINESGYVGVGTVAPGRPLTVNGDGTNAAIRILNSAFASSTNTALYTFRGWLPIDLGTTKYYIQVFN